MRNLTGAILSACMIATVPATVVAQLIELDEPVGLGGRVEILEAGYAITLPDEWLYVRPSDSTVDALVEEVVSVVPDLGPAIDAALASGLGFSFLAFNSVVDDDFTENCNVLDRPSEGLSIDAIGASEIEKLEGFADIIVSGPELSVVELPSGRAIKIDLGLRLPEFDTASTSYLLTDLVWVHTLTCTDLSRPEDAWLSIAETFELLAPVR